MINRPTTIRIYSPLSQGMFSTTAEPTVENAGAENYINQIISDGGQIINAMDSHPGRFVAIGGILLAGDDSTFASDTGNWDISDGGVSIAGGKLVFAAVGVGDGAEITVPVGAGDYGVQFTTDSIAGGTLKIIVGGANGTTRSTNDTFIEDITAAAGTTIKFEVVTGPLTVNISAVTADLKHAVRIDLETNSLQGYNSAILDGHNLLEALPAAVRRNFQVFHNTADNFGGGTEIVPAGVYSGLLGKEQPLQVYNGIDAKTRVDALAAVYSPEAASLVFRGLKLEGVTLDNFTSSSEAIFGMWEANTDRVQVSFGNISGGIVNEVITLNVNKGGNNVNYYTKDQTILDGNEHDLVITITEQTVLIYVDGVAVAMETPDGSNTASGFDVGVAYTAGVIGARHLSGADSLFFEGDLPEFIPLNRVLSPAEILDWHENPHLYPLAADQWGENGIYVADWTGAGDDGWAETRCVTTGGDDAVPDDAATTKDNCLRVDAFDTGGSSTHFVTKAAPGMGTTELRTVVFWYLIPTANTTVDGFTLSDFSSVTFFDGRSTGSTPAVIGTWTLVVTTAAIPSADTLGLQFYDGANNTFTDATDVVYIQGLEVIQPGAVAAYLHDGISEDQGKWLDAGDNLLHGINTNVEIVNGPDSENLGYLLYEFPIVNNNLFWFFQENKDAATALANIKAGWLPLLKYYDFEIDMRGYNGVYNYPGSKVTDTVGGTTDSESFFGRKPSWNIKFNKMSDDDFENLLKVVDTIRGKLYPFYVRFGVATEENEIPVDNKIWRVRLAANGLTWAYEFGSDQPWVVSMRIVADL